MELTVVLIQHYRTYIHTSNYILAKHGKQCAKAVLRTPCAGTIPVEASSSLTGSLEEGGLVRYELQVPPQFKLSLYVCVSQGEIQLYGSSVIPNPNSALNDFNTSVNSTSVNPCANVSINGSSSGSQTAQSDSIFVSIEGLDSTNDYTLVTSTSELPGDNNERGSGEPPDVIYPIDGGF